MLEFLTRLIRFGNSGIYCCWRRFLYLLGRIAGAKSAVVGEFIAGVQGVQNELAGDEKMDKSKLQYFEKAFG